MNKQNITQNKNISELDFPLLSGKGSAPIRETNMTFTNTLHII